MKLQWLRPVAQPVKITFTAKEVEEIINYLDQVFRNGSVPTPPQLITNFFQALIAQTSK